MVENTGTQPSNSSSDQSSCQDSLGKQPQVSTSDGLKSQNGGSTISPTMYPGLFPALLPPHQQQEQMNRGPGLYAVPVLPYMRHIAELPSNTLIPFTYNLPTARSPPEIREAAGEQGQPGDQLQQQQEAGPQRQVVRRFHFQIAIQIDLMLILKLAVVIFLFNQDGSRQRLTVLVFFASLIYLYQTGALAPVIQWLSQGMRRAAAPPQPPRPRAENLPGGLGDENAGLAEGQPIGENENEQVNDGNRGIENERAGEAPRQGGAGNGLWVIVKEIQMIVFGFITSLLPGFHNID